MDKRRRAEATSDSPGLSIRWESSYRGQLSAIITVPCRPHPRGPGGSISGAAAPLLGAPVMDP